MSAIERMISYHLSRLKDKRASVRLDAINELVLLDAFEALEVLQEIYQQDEDADVRKAALQAGRTLFLKRNQKTS